MNKKIKIVFIILGIIVIGIITTIFVFNRSISNAVSNMKQVEYNMVSKNLYYNPDLFNIKEATENDQGKVLSYFKLISNYLYEKYPNLYFYISYYDNLNAEFAIIMLYQILLFLWKSSLWVHILIKNR